MVLGRFLAGIAIGVSSALVPTYISEIAPTSLRGVLGTLNQLLIVGGILGALAINVVLPVSQWSTMFYIAAAPAVALGLGECLSQLRDTHLINHWIIVRPVLLLNCSSYLQT